MAYATGNKAGVRSNKGAAAPANNGDWERASGFLNFYLPTKGGKRRKLGAIPLYNSKVNEKTFMDWLAADEANITKVLSVLELEYRAAESDENAAFDLPE